MCNSKKTMDILYKNNFNKFYNNSNEIIINEDFEKFCYYNKILFNFIENEKFIILRNSNFILKCPLIQNNENFIVLKSDFIYLNRRLTLFEVDLDFYLGDLKYISKNNSKVLLIFENKTLELGCVEVDTNKEEGYLELILIDNVLFDNSVKFINCNLIDVEVNNSTATFTFIGFYIDFIVKKGQISYNIRAKQ